MTFSRTIRKYMRDPEIYTSANVWCEEDVAIAEELLEFVSYNPEMSDDVVVAKYVERASEGSKCDVERADHVWARLRTQFPHMFDVAERRGVLDKLDLSGGLAIQMQQVPQVSALVYDGWRGSLEWSG